MNAEQTPEQQALNALVGKWTTEARMIGSDKETKVTGTDEFRWFPGGNFLQHRVDLYVGTDKADILDMIGAYDKESRSYPLHSFDNTGGYVKLSLTIDEDGIVTIGDNKAFRSILTPSYDGISITTKGEKLEDGEWVTFMEGKLTKSEDKL
jgi:hypothetical protein